MPFTAKEAEVFELLVRSMGQAQAFNQANSYILFEVVRDLAKHQQEPCRYLADMFERVSARADRTTPLEEEAHTVNVQFRDIISTFFANVREDVKT